MIELDRHIEILLLSNDCVIVPDLGGFMAYRVDARYDEADGMFLPPIRTLGFNPQLRMNDSLLAQSYAEAYEISYPEALRRIEDEVNELRQHLETAGEYELNDIGVLRLNDEGHLSFEPCEAGILTPELYGLGAFAMPMIERRSGDIKKTEEATVPEDGSIIIKMSWLRNAVAVAAAIIAFLMIGTPITNSNKVTDVQQSAFISVPVGTKGTTPGISTLPDNPSVTEEAAIVSSPSPSDNETTEAPTEAVEEAVAAPAPVAVTEAVPVEQMFCIVMASQVTERNANLFISQLNEKGFTGASILVSGAKNIRRVIYGTYKSEADAAATLRQLRSESRIFKNTWIMEVKD